MNSIDRLDFWPFSRLSASAIDCGQSSSQDSWTKRTKIGKDLWNFKSGAEWSGGDGRYLSQSYAKGLRKIVRRPVKCDSLIERDEMRVLWPCECGVKSIWWWPRTEPWETPHALQKRYINSSKRGTFAPVGTVKGAAFEGELWKLTASSADVAAFTTASYS